MAARGGREGAGQSEAAVAGLWAAGGVDSLASVSQRTRLREVVGEGVALWALRGTAWHASARMCSLLRTDKGCGCGSVLFVVSSLWGGSGRRAYSRTTEYEGRMFAAAGTMASCRPCPFHPSQSRNRPQALSAPFFSFVCPPRAHGVGLELRDRFVHPAV
jgi:hypothetical protein